MSKPNYHQHSRSEMKQFLPSTYSKVLEIGCGAGNFRGNLTLDHEYWGVEIDVSAAAISSTKLDKVLVGDYVDVVDEIPEHYFDLIICNDVVEHMEHHVDFLISIKNKLSSNGRLVLSIPNVRYLPNLTEILFLRDWRYRDSGILDSTHLRFFTKKSLRRVLVDTDWEIHTLKGINRYGSNRFGHKLLISYIAQLIFGFDVAYLQFAVTLTKK